MNSTTAPAPFDAHEKTIDLRIERLHTLIGRADAIHNYPEVNAPHAARAITALTENRVFVAAHVQTLIEQIVTTAPADKQDEQITARVRPLTLLLEQANVAIARMRHQLHGADL